MTILTAEAVQQHAAEAAFGGPLVQNNLRAFLVEAMIDLALPAGWRWSGKDWAAWDFEHVDGTRLEVKQSAARQTWAPPEKRALRRFDIAPRTGRWDGLTWLPEPGRFAHLWVFADHPIVDDTADHRAPEQWCFYLIAAEQLPASRSLSLLSVQRLAARCSLSEVGGRIEKMRITRDR